MNETPNGDGQETVDYPQLAKDLAMQVGHLTAEMLARGQIIDRLRAEVAELHKVLSAPPPEPNGASRRPETVTVE